jgi:hypothetical protein
MRVSVAACVLLVVGCDIDPWSGPAPDAPSPVDGATTDGDGDASNACGGWRQVSLGPATATLLETRAVHPQRTARVRIDHAQCPGDYPGEWSVGFTLENEYVSITATVWRAGPDCAQPELASRVVGVGFLYPGNWKIVTANGIVSVTVVAPPAGACGSSPPGACQRDCDCAYDEVCLSGAGVQRCARPCEYSRDCLGRGRCGDENGLTDVCRRAQAECNATIPCPDGFACDQGVCVPTFELSQYTRHECDCDADCESPLRCVAHFVGGTDPWRKQCEQICPTPFDGWCQGGHTCNSVASIDYHDGVCGWVGE